VASRFSKAILWISAAIYTVGFFVAFLLGPILPRLDRS
jgi:nitrate/nitrite transporter NarK